MQIVVRRQEGEYEVTLTVHDDEAEVGIVTSEWFAESPEWLEVDGAVVPATAPIGCCGLRAGSVVGIPGAGFQAPDDAAPRDLAVPARIPFNRPPRTEYPVALPSLTVPAAPPEPKASTRFGWGALVVPLVLGLVMAVLFHPRMALFALFSPAMMVANWMEDRRRSRRQRRETATALDGDLADFKKRFGQLAAAAARLKRREVPQPTTLIAAVAAESPRMWERRRHHPDVMTLGVGTGAAPWSPSLTLPPAGPAPEVQAIVAGHGALRRVPIEVSCDAGEVVGIAGDRAWCLAVARSLLVQAAILHGPADLEVSVATDARDLWDWVKWLPHVDLDSAAGRRRLGSDDNEIHRMVAALLAEGAQDEGVGAALSLLVVDVADIAAERWTRVRDGLNAAARGRAAAIAIAATATELPSVCTTIVTVAADGSCEVRSPVADHEVRGVQAWGVAAGAAREIARRLARYRDPDVAAADADLPNEVRLAGLLDLEEVTPASVVRRWQSRLPSPRPAAVIGQSSAGPLILDLIADGPHALLAGTTGAGKSELLRTLVASLALTVDPEHLTFVLIDYKGGSAFDACADLPHTVGVVTDLDGHLASRALTCLEAELRYREERLRAAGASDLDGYVARGPDNPLPRLLVVVDEFAALAKELPAFMASLVDVAQRGRSLGVHLLLATQRPSGVISDSIRANTNLRLALRVQDVADSTDVLGIADAAHIGRLQAGRGLVRRGPGDVVAFQTALVTAPADRGARTSCDVQPFVFGFEQPGPSGGPESSHGPTELDQLVAATQGAAESLGCAPPRRPWPDPLATEIHRDHLDVTAPPDAHRARVAVPLGLGDEPARQRQRTAWWSTEAGNLLIYGVPGSGTTTALATFAIGVADRYPPDDVHLYVMDFDDQRLAPLAGLQHVGAVIGANDRERQVRLLRFCQKEVEARRRAVAADPEVLADLPAIVVLVDNYAGFAAAFDEPSDMAVRAILPRLAGDGPGVGIHLVATAKQPIDVPAQLGSVVPTKVALRLTDRYEYSGLGVTVDDVPETPGRGYESGTGREIQIALPAVDGVAAAVETMPVVANSRPPQCIEVLPSEVKVADVIDAARVFDLEWLLPVGIGDFDLAPTGFALGDGDHVVIAGPPRSGKSTTLTALAAIVATHRPDLTITGIALRRSPLRDCPDVTRLVTRPDDVDGVLQGLSTDTAASHLILIDDAGMVDDVNGVLAALVGSRRPGVHIVAADQADTLRSAYGHWTKEARRSRMGLALRPTATADGDLWQTALPRRGPSEFPPGRGYLVADGRVELVQVAWQ